MFDIFTNKKGIISPKSKITENKENFDFAFSFSGEETRQKVIVVAKKLENLGFKVFVDK